jgi:hypothetical protein
LAAHADVWHEVEAGQSKLEGLSMKRRGFLAFLGLATAAPAALKALPGAVDGPVGKVGPPGISGHAGPIGMAAPPTGIFGRMIFSDGTFSRRYPAERMDVPFWTYLPEAVVVLPALGYAGLVCVGIEIGKETESTDFEPLFSHELGFPLLLNDDKSLTFAFSDARLS